MGIFDALDDFFNGNDDYYKHNSSKNNYGSDILDTIEYIVQSLWEAVKKIFVRIIDFTKNILSFFQEPNRLRQLQADKNKVAISIKEKLDNGNYAVVNCLFDKKTNTVEDIQEDAIGVVGEDMDRNTKKMFGKKNMMVLQ